MTPTGKAQAVRLVDVFALGPFMVWASFRLSGLARSAMFVAGALTVWYNARNYNQIRTATGECGCLFKREGR